MQSDDLLIVTTGDNRYAVARSQVRMLSRVATSQQARSMAEALGARSYGVEPYALVVSGVDADVAFYVGQMDLRGRLPRLDLPNWLAQQAHPAVVGLVLDNTDLFPLIDLAQLALHTGHRIS